MLLLLCIVVLIYVVYSIRNHHRYNLEAGVIQLQEMNHAVISNKLRELSPIVIHNTRFPEKITSQWVVKENPGYIVNDNNRNILLSSILDPEIDTIMIHRNSKLSEDTEISENLNGLGKYFQNYQSCNRFTTVTIGKGSVITTPKESIRDIHIIYQIEGDATLYLINPKHHDDIRGKSPHKIKKWAHKINMKPGILVSIPTNWLYVVESNERIVQGSYESDTYATVVYNYFR
jgi:hypothetical protein